MSSYEISLLGLVAINLLFASSLNLITGFCGQVSLGHAAFFGAGAYAGALLLKVGLPIWLAWLPAAMVAGLFGLIVGFASLRVRNDFLAITTMGVGFVFVGFVRKQHWLGAEMGVSGIPAHGLGTLGFALLCLLAALLAIGLSLYTRRSWLGFAFTAVADDEDTAQTIGIDVARYKLAAFTMGTALAGVAGAEYAQYTRFIVPDAFGFTVSISVLAMVIIGGVGSVWGVAVATIILTLMPELFRFINDYKLLIYGALLVGTMRFSPGGIAGLTERLWRMRSGGPGQRAPSLSGAAGKAQKWQNS